MQYSSKCHFKVLLLNALWHFYDKATNKSRPFVLASCSSQTPSNPNPQDSCAVCLCGISSGLIYMSFVSDVMVGMGFTREEVRESLNNQKYNEVTATYLLLARKNEVSRITKRADVINTHHSDSLTCYSYVILMPLMCPSAGDHCHSVRQQSQSGQSPAWHHHQRNEQTLLLLHLLLRRNFLLRPQATAQCLHLPPPATAL